MSCVKTTLSYLTMSFFRTLYSFIFQWFLVIYAPCTPNVYISWRCSIISQFLHFGKPAVKVTQYYIFNFQDKITSPCDAGCCQAIPLPSLMIQNGDTCASCPKSRLFISCPSSVICTWIYNEIDNNLLCTHPPVCPCHPFLLNMKCWLHILHMHIHT